MERAQNDGAIAIGPLEEETFYGNIGFEAKKHGAVYNLMERRRFGWPTPTFNYKFSWRPRKREPFKTGLEE